ncbi:MAG: pentapeptide repeat-containing protein [bacterium]|nr:pentapeptide repeat-containing protein [bacterium]
MEKYIEGEEFNSINYQTNPISIGEYEDCTFRNCNFSNASLKEVVFVDCEFIECDLSNSNINLTSFKNVNFKDCKMIGLQFEHCNDFMFEVQFSNCQLDLCSFFQRSLSKKAIIECSFKEADLSEANCEQTRFDKCDFTGANFDRTNLTKADFSTSINYIINPNDNNIKKARFSYPGLVGLLSHLDISIQ